MYEKQFQFRSRPFCCIPSAEHYFPSSSIDAALDAIKLCIDRASGPSVLYGQSGWGKSQLLAVLHRDYKQHFRVANIQACTRMSRRHDLLQNILFELGQPYRDMSEGELRLALIDYLKPTTQCPHGVLFLVDDGHTLPNRLLDELRMITNFVRDGQPRVRMVIAGTQALEERLTHPHLESFNQRVAARCYLQCLRRDEVEPYIRHQVVRAGCPDPNLFHGSAIAAVAQLCEGNLRTINQICDHALILAASCGQSTVSGEVIAEAFSDIQRLPATMWTSERPSNANTVSDDPATTSSVVEFGPISDPANPSARDGTEADSGESQPEAEIATAESISESIDEFSKMVDSLADLYVDSFDGDPNETNPTTEIEPAENEGSAMNPFDEPFAEECCVEDHYAQLAAQQNRFAANLTEQDVTHLEQHLQRLQAEISTSIETPTATAMPNPRVLFTDPLIASYETPLVDYRIDRQRADELEGGGETAIGQAQGPVTTGQDDRDMLLISTMNHGSPVAPRLNVDDRSGVCVTRGHAVRLEYGLLFQQLRGNDESHQPSHRK